MCGTASEDGKDTVSSAMIDVAETFGRNVGLDVKRTTGDV